LERFRGDERAWRSWLFTIARRRAIDESRRRSRHRVAPLDDLPPARQPTTADAGALALDNLAAAAVVQAVLALPPLQAEVILLRMLAGLDNEAVAQIVGRSPGAVRVAAHRGLRRLAQVLSPAGVTP
jgi:RNA polymerase sigma-70 factor (ECF subfamily)